MSPKRIGGLRALRATALLASPAQPWFNHASAVIATPMVAIVVVIPSPAQPRFNHAPAFIVPPRMAAIVVVIPMPPEIMAAIARDITHAGNMAVEATGTPRTIGMPAVDLLDETRSRKLSDMRRDRWPSVRR